MSEAVNASRNIEIKARIGDNVQFERKIEIAKKLTNNYTVIKQRDVFFNVTSGRLKLRFLEVNNNNNYTFIIHTRIPQSVFLFNFTFLYTEHKVPIDSIP